MSEKAKPSPEKTRERHIRIGPRLGAQVAPQRCLILRTGGDHVQHYPQLRNLFRATKKKGAGLIS